MPNMKASAADQCNDFKSPGVQMTLQKHHRVPSMEKNQTDHQKFPGHMYSQKWNFQGLISVRNLVQLGLFQGANHHNCFKLFLTTAIWDMLVEKTNLYYRQSISAKSSNVPWTDESFVVIQAFIGLINAIGL